MLSILIPIYNYNVFPLVLELHKQCLECKIDFEILCQDDASFSPLNVENEKVNSLINCSFVALKQNIAHRENRNSLAERAIYKYLLFIDGDSNLLNSDFIQKYIDNLFDFDVIYGGRLHPEKCPSNQQKLRWKYGKYTEDKTAENRKKSPYQSLLFNNTVIKKSCFNKVKFDKNMKKYGHDDTQLSYQLSLLNAKINHINNPIEHGDIDSNNIYLNKTKESVENLVLLYQENKIGVEFVKLIYLFECLKKIKLNNLISKFYIFFEKPILNHLSGNNPSLLIFNLFKVVYFCFINSRYN